MSHADAVIETLRARRSVRRFTEQPVSERARALVLEAGERAPYALIGTRRGEPVRRFFVLERDSELRQLVQRRFTHRMQWANKLGDSPASAHVLRFVELARSRRLLPLETFRAMTVLAANAASLRGHFQALPTAPLWIIVAERRRAPLMGATLIHKSLSHCLQNMWVMATALGLGFQLVSLVSMLSEDHDACEALGVEAGEYEFDACLLGHPRAPNTAPRAAT